MTAYERMTAVELLESIRNDPTATAREVAIFEKLLLAIEEIEEIGKQMKSEGDDARG